MCFCKSSFVTAFDCCVVQFKLCGGANIVTILCFYACHRTQDKLEKDRLSQRKFGHIRHHCYYKNLCETPFVESLGWLDPKRKEFWRTDVEKVLKKDEDKRRARRKVKSVIVTVLTSLCRTTLIGC